jgi:hypothetical protein
MRGRSIRTTRVRRVEVGSPRRLPAPYRGWFVGGLALLVWSSSSLLVSVLGLVLLGGLIVLLLSPRYRPACLYDWLLLIGLGANAVLMLLLAFGLWTV